MVNGYNSFLVKAPFIIYFFQKCLCACSILSMTKEQLAPMDVFFFCYFGLLSV